MQDKVFSLDLVLIVYMRGRLKLAYESLNRTMPNGLLWMDNMNPSNSLRHQIVMCQQRREWSMT